MKPLMLIPPAQAEALDDAQEGSPTSDRFSPVPWLDDDASEDDPRGRTSAIKSPAAATDANGRRFSRLQAA